LQDSEEKVIEYTLISKSLYPSVHIQVSHLFTIKLSQKLYLYCR